MIRSSARELGKKETMFKINRGNVLKTAARGANGFDASALPLTFVRLAAIFRALGARPVNDGR